MKISSSVQKQQVEALGLRFFEPRWLKMPWQADAEKPVDVAEVASAVNQGKSGLKVELGERRWPVASAADFQALVQLQQPALENAEAPVLARQLGGLMGSGFTVSGMAAYPAYLSLSAGESVELENSRGLPVARLSGQDLESQITAALKRQRELEEALASGEGGGIALALLEQSQNSSRTFQDLLKKAPGHGRAEQFFERTQSLGREHQRDWFALAAEPVKNVPYSDRVDVLTSLKLTDRPLDQQARAALQAAAWIRRQDDQAPVTGPLQQIQRQSGEHFLECLSQLAQLPEGLDWAGVGVFAGQPLIQRAELYRQAAIGRLEESLQAEAFAKSANTESWALLHQNLGRLKGPSQRQAWQAFSAQLAEKPAQALWGSAFAAASQDVEWASRSEWGTQLPGARILGDLRSYSIPANFPAKEALGHTLKEMLLGGRFLSSFGPSLTSLLEGITKNGLSSSQAQELLQAFSQLSRAGQAALGQAKPDLQKALAAEERERSKAWDRALLEEPKRMTAWAQVGAARELGMHSRTGLMKEPEMAEPVMKLFRAIANGESTLEQAIAQVHKVMSHLEQRGVAEPEVAAVYLECYQKLTALGREEQAAVRTLDDTLVQLEASEKFRQSPAKCFQEAFELGLLCPAESKPDVQIKESEDAVVIGGILLKKKKQL